MPKLNKLIISYISSKFFEKKLRLSNDNYQRIYKLIMDLIPNNWKHLATLTEISQKPLLKTIIIIITIKALGK